MATILFVDNDAKIMKTYSTAIERNLGHSVQKASSSGDARNHLSNGTFFDLAIVDVHLEEENNPEDRSGLYLAEDIAKINIPTLILTVDTDYSYVRRAQTWFPDGTPANMNFVGKNENMDIFLQVVASSLRGKNVFIVHGTSPNDPLIVKDFVNGLGLNPIILSEQVSIGKTIIEKLETYSNVAYVIVLLLPEDTCDDGKRGRQNVIFELGYFTAKYGRQQVAVLYGKDTVLPSDYSGVVYIPYDPSASNWKIQLVKEMRASMLNVSL